MTLAPAINTFSKYEVPQDDTRRPMSLAELKRRLQVGVKVRWTWAHYSGSQNRECEVHKTQTNAVGFFEPSTEKYSWIHFEKGKRFEETDTGFRIVSNGETLLIGEWA